MSRLSRYLALLAICNALATEVAPAQTTTVIPAKEAAASKKESFQSCNSNLQDMVTAPT
jgi:hypothetical protein